MDSQNPIKIPSASMWNDFFTSIIGMNIYGNEKSTSHNSCDRRISFYLLQNNNSIRHWDHRDTYGRMFGKDDSFLRQFFLHSKFLFLLLLLYVLHKKSLENICREHCRYILLPYLCATFLYLYSYFRQRYTQGVYRIYPFLPATRRTQEIFPVRQSDVRVLFWTHRHTAQYIHSEFWNFLEHRFQSDAPKTARRFSSRRSYRRQPLARVYKKQAHHLANLFERFFVHHLEQCDDLLWASEYV